MKTLHLVETLLFIVNTELNISTSGLLLDNMANKMWENYYETARQDNQLTKGSVLKSKRYDHTTSPFLRIEYTVI